MMTDAGQNEAIELNRAIRRTAHDLQAPMRRIDAFLSLLVRCLGAVDPQCQQYVDQIQRDARLGQARLQALSTYARLARDFDRAALALRPFLEQCAATQTNPAICVRVDAPDLTIMAHEPTLRQAVVAVLDNAVRFARTEVWVRGRGDATGFTIAVQDDGSGLEMEPVRCLDLFTSLTPQTHMGLGLAVAQRVMRLHGGQVRFAGESAGLTVTLAGRTPGIDAD